MVLIVTCPRSVGMIRYKGANLKHANITNTNGAGVTISMVMLMFAVVEWYVLGVCGSTISATWPVPVADDATRTRTWPTPKISTHTRPNPWVCPYR